MWSADMYGKFEKERKQPSIDLLNKIDGEKFERIIDIGCGSGMSTLPLKKRFTESEIVGVDLSENMLDKARKSISGVTWIQRDCSRKLNNLGTFDLVFSNAFIQWIPNQEEFIKNTKELLNKNGVFAIQIPCMVAIIKRAANRLLFFIPKAEIIPKTIGTMQPTRAVVLGTKKAKIKPTKIIPATMRFVLEPTLDKMPKAIRLSRFVCIIAAAKNRAAPTRIVPLELRPANVIDTALPKPITCVGLSRAGAVPNETNINDAIIAALTG